MNTHSKLLAGLTSQVGRKILTGVTGFVLVLFVIGHLSGNLSLLKSDPNAFNGYARFLHSFGAFVYVIEVLLTLVILTHAYIGISIALRKKEARKQGYEMYRSKGGQSKQSISSRTMVYTGTILLIFLVIHIIQFRFGAGISAGYITTLNGEEARDLRRLVVEVFQNPGWVAFYVGVMILLGFHLRHGIWSMLQSLGAMRPRYTPVIYGIALILGILLAVGFLLLPIWLYIYGGAAV
ncbi:MAG: succinate dehydrogenase cytochrome b subunit [Candidatus Kapaibacterium sp.]